ncbi:m-AAA protease-interacting protein 1, mitochondrial [Ascaphus truei]|uniref:m-AAA protease-interacting protein 1, mitochondrial n=1 Tax=Ascaphus truei TaxID=8439 RepID=UPI003F594AF1
MLTTLTRALRSTRMLLLQTVAGVMNMCAGVTSIPPAPSLIRLPAVPGNEPSRANDVLLCPARETLTAKSPHHVIYFPGDVQAFTLVSKLLSQCNFDALENLVTSEALQNIKEKCSLLSDNHRNALAAISDDIMYTTTGDVGIYYDDNGRKFVSILMRFWYLTCADIPEESLEGTKVIQVAMGDENVKNTKRLLTANYEFRREFTQGVQPDWIITRIEHSKLLD